MKLLRSLFTAAAAAIVLSGLAACASLDAGRTADTTPAQRVFALRADYVTALSAAVTYASLPLCSTNVPQPCSDPDVVIRLAQAKDVAGPALDAAERIVRDRRPDDPVAAQVVAAAREAVTALTRITATLQTR